MTDTLAGSAAATLSASDGLWERMLDAAPDAMLAVDAGGVMLLANAQAERMFGYLRSELVGESVEMLVPQRFRGGHRARRGRFLAAPRPRAMGSGSPLFAVARDGREFPVEITLSSVETKQGRLAIAAIRDLSERAHAEREAAEGAPVGILTLAPDGTGRYVNPRWSELAGVDRDGCLAAGWWLTVHPEDLARVRAAWREMLAGARLAIEFRFVHASGNIVSVVGAGGPGEAGGDDLVVSLTDVTGLREAERRDRETSEWRDDDSSETGLRALLDHAPMAISLRDAHGRFVLANERAARLIGRPVSEVVGRTPAELWSDPAVLATIDAAEHEAVAAGRADERSRRKPRASDGRSATISSPAIR